MLAEKSHVWRGRTMAWLVLVAAAFVAAQVVFVPPRMELGWDEAVYVSQVSRHIPAAFFSAPRARGVSVLVAPVTAWTTSTVILRVYLAILSGAGLFVAFWIWRRLLPPGVLALAGVIFSGLWITQFYGPQAMPNLWVALGCVAAVGCFLRSAGDAGDRAALAGLVASLAFVALMRPSDGVWLAIPLLATALIVSDWRRPALFAVIAVGLAAGGADWVVEAFVHYGGVLARLHRSSQIEGGIGWHVAIADQIRALDGRTLCRPCNVAWRHPITAAWWFALPPLTAGGLMIAARTRRTVTVLLPVLCAAAVATPYLFLIDYAAPRFLLAAYALLAIPVAVCLSWLAVGVPRSLRPVTIPLVCIGLAGHLAIQHVVVARTVRRTDVAHEDYARIAAELHRMGVRPPCVLTGDQDVPVAFYARCASADIGGNNANATVGTILSDTARMPVAVIEPPGTRPPAYARAWPSYALAHLHAMKGDRVYLSPPGLRPTQSKRRGSGAARDSRQQHAGE
jgi:hypothetical protein